MKTIVLNIGHGKKGDSFDPGAVNDAMQITEHEFNRGLSDLIAQKLTGNDMVDVVKVFQTNYSGLPKIINGLKPALTVSMHCNAAENKQANGSEVLYKQGCSICLNIAEVFVKHFDAIGLFKSRGVKQLSQSGRGAKLVYSTDAPCVICEPFFISNTDELSIAIDSMDDLADAYCQGIIEAAGLVS